MSTESELVATSTPAVKKSESYFVATIWPRSPLLRCTSEYTMESEREKERESSKQVSGGCQSQYDNWQKRRQVYIRLDVCVDRKSLLSPNFL